MFRQIEQLIQEQISPALKQHGGSVELIDIENNKVYVKMLGGCQGCSSAMTTVKQGMERTIKQNFPLIDEVIDITDHKSGKNPYM